MGLRDWPTRGVPGPAAAARMPRSLAVLPLATSVTETVSAGPAERVRWSPVRAAVTLVPAPLMRLATSWRLEADERSTVLEVVPSERTMEPRRTPSPVAPRRVERRVEGVGWGARSAPAPEAPE